MRSLHHAVSAALLSLAALAGCTTDLRHAEEHAEHGPVFIAQDDALIDQLSDDDEGWSVTPLLPAPAAANRLGLRFDARGPVAVQARTSSDDGVTFGPWTDATVTWAEEIAHNARADLTAGATHAQLRFTAPVEAGLTFVAVELFEFVPPMEDESGAIDVVDEGGDGQALAADGIVVTRSQWGARTRNCPTSLTPQKLTIHHTDTPNSDSISMAARVRQIQAFHIDSRGWCDIGYHFLIGQDGQVYQGRPENRIGAHAAGANSNNVGISFIGSFSTVVPSSSMMSAAARIMKSLSSVWGITLNRTQVKGHRQVGTTSTTCPGEQIYSRLQSLIDLAIQGATTPTTPTTPTPPPATPTAPTGSFSDVPTTHAAYAAIEEMKTAGVFVGCGNGKFCPDANVTRAQLAHAFAVLETTTYTPVSIHFNDVSTSNASYADIKETYSRGIIQECATGGFCPTGSVTRAGMAVFLKRSLTLAPGAPATPSFVDVATSHWAFDSIERMFAEGIVNGCSESPRAFCPADALTRAQAAVLLAAAY